MTFLWRDYACDSWIPVAISGEIKSRDEIIWRDLWRSLLSNGVSLSIWEIHNVLEDIILSEILPAWIKRDREKKEIKGNCLTQQIIHAGNRVKNYSDENTSMFYPHENGRMTQVAKLLAEEAGTSDYFLCSILTTIFEWQLLQLLSYVCPIVFWYHITWFLFSQIGILPQMGYYWEFWPTHYLKNEI